MLKKNIVLSLIIFLAIFLRFWNLGSIPPGVHTDEADTTYTAYSIIKTGLEPHGSLNILALEDNNTGGTHPPLYTYSQIPFIKFFGMNSFVLRIPSAIFGVLTVALVFLIMKSLLGSRSTALLGSFLMAVNPWAIHVSRQGLGEGISLFLVLLGAAFFLYSVKYKYFLIFSALSFGLSLYSYDAPKIFLPPFLLLFFYFYRSVLLKIKKFFLTFILIFTIFYVSILQLTFFQGNIQDYNKSSIFSSIAENVDYERFQTEAPLWLSSIFHNKLSVSLKRFETSYASVFSFNWFFVNGSGNLQHAVGNHGQFFLFELPFFFIGMYLAFKKNLKLGLFLLGWMLIGALPGGLTSGNYAYRSIHMLPIPITFSSLGIVWLWELLGRRKSLYKQFVKLLLLSVMLIYISSYLITYFFDYPVYASEYWAKQQDDAIKFVIQNKNKYENVFVDGGEPWAVGYAFFSAVDPKIYQSAYKNQSKFKDVTVMKIDNISFGIFQLQYADSSSAFFPPNSLIITNAVNFPKEKFIKSFNDPGRIRPIFKVFEVK